MATAESSLQNDIEGGVQFSVSDTVNILGEIIDGLTELNGLVHRDLKPGNILLHEGKWKIADFGIARFVEESTSLNTLAECLSPPYAAPEQWLRERSEVSTDLYALGCIVYQLLSGKVPYNGPRIEDYRDQHLNKAPASLPDSVPPKLKTLVGMLLRKPANARPSLSRVRELCKNIEEEQRASLAPSPVAEVAARLEQKRAQEESAAAELRAKARARDDLANSGRAILKDIMSDLRSSIVRDAPTCGNRARNELVLGSARIALPTDFFDIATLPPGMFPNTKCDVVLATAFGVVQTNPSYRWESALLYCQMLNSKDYRWYEVGFWSFNGDVAPRSMLEGASGIPYRYYHPDMAMGPGLHVYQVAFGPNPIDDENEAEFIERWTTLFAVAAEGRLKYPSRLPLGGDYWKNLGIYGI